MAKMLPILLPLLMLVAGCFCSPTPIKIGGKIIVSNHFNGSYGGVVSAVRDGLSFNTTGGADAVTLWKPKLGIQGYYSSGNDTKVVDASMGATVYNSLRPAFQSAFGRNSNGTWIAGLTGQPGYNGKIVLAPIFQYEQGDEALKLLGIPPTGSENKKGDAAQATVKDAPNYYGTTKPYGSYPNGPYPHQLNPYAFNFGALTPYVNYSPNSFDPRMYGVPTPNMAYGNFAPNAYGANSYALNNNPYMFGNIPSKDYGTPNPYAAYYANPHGMGQWQMPQLPVAESQMDQSQVSK